MGKKPRVTFKLERVAEGDWQIQAIHPEEETRYIKGFKTKAEVDEWLNGTRQHRLAAIPGLREVKHRR